MKRGAFPYVGCALYPSIFSGQLLCVMICGHMKKVLFVRKAYDKIGLSVLPGVL